MRELVMSPRLAAAYPAGLDLIVDLPECPVRPGQPPRHGRPRREESGCHTPPRIRPLPVTGRAAACVRWGAHAGAASLGAVSPRNGARWHGTARSRPRSVSGRGGGAVGRPGFHGDHGVGMRTSNHTHNLRRDRLIPEIGRDGLYPRCQPPDTRRRRRSGRCQCGGRTAGGRPDLPVREYLHCAPFGPEAAQNRSICMQFYLVTP
jgi:hypothetical protein